MTEEKSTEPSRSPKLSRVDWGVLALVVLTCLPALVFRYLPMTDLPQHLAVVSILASPTDPSLGFDAYYEVKWDASLYVLPYLMALGLSKFLGLELAMRTVVFLSMLSFPLGIAAILRAMRKPLWLTVLALPFVYDRAFFWGFLNFKLSIGLALFCIALLVHPVRNRPRNFLLGLVAILVSLTHIYGLAFLLGFCFLRLISADRTSFLRRTFPLIPALSTLVVWGVQARSASGFGEWVFPPLSMRFELFSDSVFGGYADSTETWILLAWVLSVVVLVAKKNIRGPRLWQEASPAERALTLFVVLNLLLYFVLPQHTSTAKFIHFRHAVLALGLVPLILPIRAMTDNLRPGVLLVGLVGLIVPMTHWTHLSAFDWEASEFDPIVEAVPEASRILPLNFEGNGGLLETQPYAHFAAIVQARRGGIIATTFPQHFWNIPLRLRESDRTHVPAGFEFMPGRYYDPSWANWYSHVIVRSSAEDEMVTSEAFPFRLLGSSGVWHLYEKVEDTEVEFDD